MKDRAGNELQVGDEVYYLKAGTSTSWLAPGTIVRFTPKRVVFHERLGVSSLLSEVMKEPRSVIKPYRAP